MRRIGKEVGISAPSIYRHFESRDAMVQAVMAEGSKLFASYMFRALEQTTPVDQLEATGAQYLKFAFDNEMTIGLDLPLAQLPAFSGGRISVGLASEVFGAQDSLGGPGYLVPPTVDEDPALPRAVITVAGKSRAIHLQTFGDPANPPLLFCTVCWPTIGRSFLFASSPMPTSSSCGTSGGWG